MTKLVDIINILRNTNSTPDKVKTLKRHMNDSLKDVLKLTYEPLLTYGITMDTNINSYTIGEHRKEQYLTKEELQLLVHISERRIVGNQARDLIKTANAKAGDTLLSMIINKDLRCGISTAIINKAVPKLLSTHKIQKAVEKKLNKLKFPLYAEHKYDGVRLTTVVSGFGDNKLVNFYSSGGREVNLPLFKQLFKTAPFGVYDGELIVGEGEILSRTSVSGMLNSAMKGGRIQEAALKYMLFDFIEIGEWITRNCSTLFYRRREKLLLNMPDTELIKAAQQWLVKSVDEVNTLYKSLVDNGMEGLILKEPGHLYSFKRSTSWIKMKETKTADLKCIAIEEGKGQFEGAIGALVCEGKVEGKPIQVKVGSGLTHILRCKHEDYYLNKIVELKYNSIIPAFDSTGYTLFLPRFVCVRRDKETNND